MWPDEQRLLRLLEAISSTLQLTARACAGIERLGERVLLIVERGKPTKIVLCLPTRTVKGIVMPNFELPNDEVVTISIETTNSNGAVEPVPAGDVFTAKSSSASLGVAVSADKNGNPTLVLTPLVQASPGISVTVTDSAGLAQATLVVDIVPDVTDTNIVLDVADATHTSQPVPTAPGP
jgi:hypothetical protein